MSSMVLEWPGRRTRRRSAGNRLWCRLAALPRLWARQRARRRFVNQVLAETHDPRLLADIGLDPVQTPHVERWVMAMLYHQH